MREWRAKVYLGDLIYDDDHSPTYLGSTMAARLMRLPYWGASAAGDLEFQSIVAEFDTAESIDALNEALEALYDWGDVDKRLWVDSFTIDPEAVAAANRQALGPEREEAHGDG